MGRRKTSSIVKAKHDKSTWRVEPSIDLEAG